MKMKTKHNYCAALTALALLTLPVCALAQDPAASPGSSAGPDAVASFITQQAAAHPWLLATLVWLGVAGRILQPLLDFLHQVVKETPTPKDDELLARIEASKVLKYTVKALAFLSGINPVHPAKR
jgi:hypothetical protein